jgi:hypothetical protein
VQTIRLWVRGAEELNEGEIVEQFETALNRRSEEAAHQEEAAHPAPVEQDIQGQGGSSSDSSSILTDPSTLLHGGETIHRVFSFEYRTATTGSASKSLAYCDYWISLQKFGITVFQAHSLVSR